MKLANPVRLGFPELWMDNSVFNYLRKGMFLDASQEVLFKTKGGIWDPVIAQIDYRISLEIWVTIEERVNSDNIL
jgi:hypothetical protein